MPESKDQNDSFTFPHLWKVLWINSISCPGKQSQVHWVPYCLNCKWPSSKTTVLPQCLWKYKWRVNKTSGGEVAERIGLLMYPERLMYTCVYTLYKNVECGHQEDRRREKKKDCFFQILFYTSGKDTIVHFISFDYRTFPF